MLMYKISDGAHDLYRGRSGTIATALLLRSCGYTIKGQKVRPTMSIEPDGQYDEIDTSQLSPAAQLFFAGDETLEV